MNTIAPAAPKNNLPVLTLLAHVDATNNLEPYEVAEVDHFEGATRPDANVRVELCRTSTSPTKKMLVGAAELAAIPVSLALSPLLGPLGFVATAASSLLAFDGMQRLMDGVKDRMMHKEPSWNGTRIYDIGPDQVKGKLDSKIIEQNDSLRPTPQALGKFIADGMKAYPAQVTAFMASGHGAAYTYCSNYTVADLKTALDDAAAQAGKKVDVVILEACLMGNLESLQTLKDSARYAVVSEETMGAAGLPWNDIMSNLPKGTMTAAQFGQSLINSTVNADGIDTLAVIDLQKVEPISQSVENLAHELRRVVADGGKSQVRAALKGATAYPRGFDPLTRMSFNVRDLSELTDAVEANVKDPKARDAATAVKSALQDAIVYSTTSEKYENAGHVTIQGMKPFFKAEPYVAQTGFSEWGQLLQEARRF